MGRTLIALLATALVAIVAAALTAWAQLQYEGDIRAARERVLAGSQVVQTPCGPIEYTQSGDGPPVLIVHGPGGGYDQGLLLAQTLAGPFRYVIPSRYGYLRTPVPAGATPEMQADAYACLLDELNVRQVAVVGLSAGGPSSLLFALRHPGRCAALVMVSAVSCDDVNPRTLFGDLSFRLLESDPVYWLLIAVARSKMQAFFGVPKELQAKLTPGQMDRVDQVIDTMLPVSMRAAGIRLDRHMIRSGLEKIPLERIAAPTLVVHAKDDSSVRYTHGQYTAEHIPDARLLTLEEGGRLVIALDEEAQSEVVAFLRRHARRSGR